MLIIEINGVTCKPSEMSIGINDVSSSDAGRDQTGLMHKNLVTTKYKIELAWWNPHRDVVAQVLTAVKPEYFSVRFYAPDTNSIVTKTMYVGDRSAPYQMWGDDRSFFSKLSFNLIER